MNLAGITRTVADLEQSRQFYEETLGFERNAFYAPTGWQSYKCQEGVFFAVGLAPGSTNEISFTVVDIEALWEKVRDRAEV